MLFARASTSFWLQSGVTRRLVLLQGRCEQHLNVTSPFITSHMGRT
jgi:hypothetical protein